jgi:tetratricopeptide (TPR) repeat protein
MELPVGSANVRRILLVGAALISVLLTIQAARIWLANDLLDSGQLPAIEHGARILPGDAEAWDRLGRFQQWDFADSDPGAAVLDYERAVREEPLSPYYWMDLASAYEQTGDMSRANDAYRQAEAAYPVSAEVAWHYGNFLLRQGQNAQAMKEIQRAVRTDASLLPLAISRIWVSSHDVNVLTNQVLPANPDAYFRALDFFQSIRDPGAGLLVWNKLLSLGQPFPLSRSFPFLDQLIGADRAEDARRVWDQAFQAAGLAQDQPGPSLIDNGGFTHNFSNGGLGWRWDAPLGVSIDFDSPRIPNGTRSVRLDFGGGNNTDLGAPYQYVPVEPSRYYHFQGYLKTDRITTESGLRFSIVDPHHPGLLNVVTQNLTGTNPWTPAQADISTSPQTHFLLVRLYRAPSRLFENKLGGTAWMAEVSLVPAEKPEKKEENPQQ